MELQELQGYIEERNQEGLVKCEAKFELGELSTTTYYVVKTKETYVYGDEADADDRINVARQIPGFESSKKTFKAGKVSKKTGEELTPDTFTVVIVINH